jgi:hypothetical protein
LRNLFFQVHKIPTPENLMYLRANRFVDIGNFFASEQFSGRSVITSTTDDADVRRFEALEQNSEKVSDLLEGLALDSSDSESDPIRDQVRTENHFFSSTSVVSTERGCLFYPL